VTLEGGRQIISLNGDGWRLMPASPGAISFEGVAFVPAVVPGDVRLDLARAGYLPDPTFGRNSLAAQKVDEQDWWLLRSLGPLEIPTDKRLFLQLHGVDYLSDVYVHGHHLGRHEGMFSSQLYELTDLLAGEPGPDEETVGALGVRLTGTARIPALHGERTDWRTRLRDRVEAASTPGRRWPHRRGTLKCQMGFGWDFAPDLPSLGLWDDAELFATGDVVIAGVWARPVFQGGWGGPVRLEVTVALDARGHTEVEVGLNLYGQNCDASPHVQLFPVSLEPGRQQLDLHLDVPEPCLWWPWERGEPNLYRLLVTVRRSAELLDSVSQTIGLRHVALQPNPGAPPDAAPWMFVVNGQPLFVRGANWVPASIFPGEVRAADYRALLGMALRANMNALRVWGGGLREKAAFYDTCDELGLLVWQEFPFACAFLTHHPRSEPYLELVEAEARAIVRDLRVHPSLALWCAGNEFNPERDRHLVETLAAVVAAEDPGRPFVPVSPADGDRHNWRVWHGYTPAADYRAESPRFASEFGLGALPVEATLRQFIPEEELWPPGPSWNHHNADWPKLWRYAAPFLGGHEKPERVSLARFITASQRAQAYGLQIAVEHHRRHKYASGGCLLWQFNAPWPAVDWAIVDHFQRPKLAYHTVTRLYAPVLVSLEYPLVPYGPGSQFCPSAWVINDLVEPLQGCRLEIRLEDDQDELLDHFQQDLDVPADSAGIVARFCWTLPAGARWVRCHLRRGNEILSVNEYDLSVQDVTQPRWWQRLRTRLGEALLGT
jgi:beta-mannosidase